ncbi:MAG: hypothetical protein J0H80_27900, partial [Rhizobiales bacterium]|nr:hypothetical protein [Hyphomicrobiales bacterium]
RAICPVLPREMLRVEVRLAAVLMRAPNKMEKKQLVKSEAISPHASPLTDNGKCTKIKRPE